MGETEGPRWLVIHYCRWHFLLPFTLPFMWCFLWILWSWQIPLCFIFCSFHYIFPCVLFRGLLWVFAIFWETPFGVTDLVWVCSADAVLPGLSSVTLDPQPCSQPARSGREAVWVRLAEFTSARSWRLCVILSECRHLHFPPEKRSRIKYMAYVMCVSKGEFLSRSVGLHMWPQTFSQLKRMPAEANSFTSKRFWDF